MEAGYDLASGDTSLGSSPKQRWIIILSLLVCTVGIINAQLMAVTERFREIGTMKCLGALDSFILRLFFLEAGMQGFAGAVTGAIIGSIFSLFNSLIIFGTASLVSVSWGAIFSSIIFSTIIGLFLSLVGVAYPAFIAARMQPVEAMRVEE
jgi:ABC-type antimicrobial peptide transport system permease subunit